MRVLLPPFHSSPSASHSFQGFGAAHSLTSHVEVLMLRPCDFWGLAELVSNRYMNGIPQANLDLKAHLTFAFSSGFVQTQTDHRPPLPSATTPQKHPSVIRCQTLVEGRKSSFPCPEEHFGAFRLVLPPQTFQVHRLTVFLGVSLHGDGFYLGLYIVLILFPSTGSSD